MRVSSRGVNALAKGAGGGYREPTDVARYNAYYEHIPETLIRQGLIVATGICCNHILEKEVRVSFIIFLRIYKAPLT